MSYKIWVKQFKATEEQPTTQHPAYPINSLSSHGSMKRTERSTAQQQTVRKYISKLIKHQQSKNSLQRTISLESVANSRNISRQTSKGNRNIPNFQPNQQTIKHASKDVEKHYEVQKSKIKYILSEPAQFIKKNITKNGQLINLDADNDKNIHESPGLGTPVAEAREARRSPRQLNLSKVLQKYETTILKNGSNRQHQTSCQTTPAILASTQRNQSWGTILMKIRQKITKAKNKYRNCDIQINRIDTDHIAMKTVGRHQEMRKTKRMARPHLQALRVQKYQQQTKKGREVETNFNPWSTEEIQIPEAAQLCQA